MIKKSNRRAKYFSFVGSYEGVIKIKGKWIRAIELNRIHKEDWIRWQGPPSPAIIRAVKTGEPFQATLLFPERRIECI